MAKRKILSVYSVATSMPDERAGVVVVRARGFVRSAGWRDAELVLNEHAEDSPPDTLDYDFVAEPPTADGTQNILPTKAEATVGRVPERIRRVRVRAEIDEIIVDVGGSSEFLTADRAGAQPPLPAPGRDGGAGRPFPGRVEVLDDAAAQGRG